MRCKWKNWGFFKYLWTFIFGRCKLETLAVANLRIPKHPRQLRKLQRRTCKKLMRIVEHHRNCIEFCFILNDASQVYLWIIVVTGTFALSLCLFQVIFGKCRLLGFRHLLSILDYQGCRQLRSSNDKCYRCTGNFLLDWCSNFDWPKYDWSQ